MKAFAFSILVLGLMSAPASFAAKGKKHHSSFAPTTMTLGTCEALPKMCPQLADKAQSCKGTSGKQSLEENAYDSDNVTCIKQRLWRKICEKGWTSEKFKVTCR